MKRFLLVLFVCLYACLVTAQKEAASSIGRMHEDTKVFYDGMLDLLQNINPRDSANNAMYEGVGGQTVDTINSTIDVLHAKLNGMYDALSGTTVDMVEIQSMMNEIGGVLNNLKGYVDDNLKDQFGGSLQSQFETNIQNYSAMVQNAKDIYHAGFSYNLPMGIEGNFGNCYFRLSIDSLEMVRGNDIENVTDDYTLAVARVALSLPFLPVQEDSTGSIGFYGKIAIKTGDPAQRNRIYLATNEYRLPIIKDKVYLNLVGHDASVSNRRLGQCAPPSSEGSYVEFDCNGLTDVQLSGYFDFGDYLVAMARSEDVAQKKNTVWRENEEDRNVYVPFEVRLQDGITSRVCFSSPFKVAKAAKNFVFEVNDAVVDLSDVHNASGFELPSGYWHEAMPEGAWTGFFLREVDVYFPEDFKLNDGEDITSGRISNMFIDDYGFTGLAVVDSLVNKDMGSSGAHLDIDRIAVEFFQNEFVRGEMDGRVKVPFLTSRDKERKSFSSTAELEQYNKTKDVLDLGFAASVSHDLYNDRYTFFARANTSDIAKDYDVPFTDKAYITVAPGTGVALTNDPAALAGSGKKLKFTLTMNGALTMVSSKSTSTPNDDGAVSKFGFDADLRGISYEGLRFSNVGNPISIDNFAIDGQVDCRFMGMTLTLKELNWVKYPDSDPSSNIVHEGLSVTSKIQFMEDANSLSAESRLTMQLSYEGDGNATSTTVSKKNKWNFDGIDIGRIALNGDFSAFSFNGYLDVYKDDAVFGKGFRGALDMSLLPLGLNIETQACFGSKSKNNSTETFNYWFAKATADMGKMKTPILLFPPNVYLASVSGGAYYRMTDGLHKIGKNKGVTEKIKEFKLADVSNYKPDEESGIGFVAGIGAYFGTETLASARTELNVSFASTGALQQIRLGGLFTMIDTKPTDFVPVESNASKKLAELNQKLSKKVGEVVPKYLTKIKQVNDLTKALEEGNLSYGSSSTEEGTISGWVNAFYVPKEKIFDLSANLNVDLYGMITGNADFSFHTDPQEWYLRLGSNTEPCYLNFLDHGESKTYFMAGSLPTYSIPPISPIAAKELDVENVDYTPYAQTLEHAKGMAFAADLNVDIDVDVIKVAYFKTDFGGGMDLLLSDRQYCHDGETHNWRGGGDVYGYFKMSTGLEWPFPEKKYPVFKGNVFMGLRGEAPAPIGGSGNIKFQCSVLCFDIPELNIHLSFGKGIDNKCE